MKKAIWPVFWAVVVDVIVLAVNFIPAVGKWTLTFVAFLPLLVGVLFFALGIALLVLTLKSKMTGLLKIFLLMTGAAPIAIPIGFVFLGGAPDIIAGSFSVLVLLALLTGISGSIVLARRQPKEAIRTS